MMHQKHYSYQLLQQSPSPLIFHSVSYIHLYRYLHYYYSLHHQMHLFGKRMLAMRTYPLPVPVVMRVKCH